MCNKKKKMSQFKPLCRETSVPHLATIDHNECVNANPRRNDQ